MTLVMFNPGPAAKIALLGRGTSHSSDVCYFRTYHGWKQAGGTCSQNIKAWLHSDHKGRREVPHLPAVFLL